MWDDPIVAETRQVREQIAARFAYDVYALGEYFKTKHASDAIALIEKITAPTQKKPAHEPITRSTKRKKTITQQVEAISV